MHNYQSNSTSVNFLICTSISASLDAAKLKGSNHRVFFQNAEGNINMGVLFNDPDVDLDDIFWFNALAVAIIESLRRKEGLISIDEELKTYSCYVELHRKGYIDS